ncbi:MAG: NAD(P)-dependent oxidoreductase [Armatimonadetes bacterium]|nr:NAD(P)-dependent oxidoreductase [Armatimonadota bacterium]
MKSQVSLEPPSTITSEQQLDDVLSTPSPALIDDLSKLDGDILILGGAGKMGPTLARQEQRALQEAGHPGGVTVVARFSDPSSRARLEEWGIRTVAADLLDRKAHAELPEAENIVFMAGRKFGSTGAESLTWAMNCYLPGIVAERYPHSRFAVFSTGNVYPLSPVSAGGSLETSPVGPVGEYAQSCLGRERIFQHFSNINSTPAVLLRISYAIDLRYGVLADVAQKVWTGDPVDVTTGHAAVIWQGDANAWCLRSLLHASTPPSVLNITGPIISIRETAEGFGRLLGRPPVITGEEAPDALVLNAGKAASLFGAPVVSIEQMMRWIAHWVESGGRTLNKPTHFEQRDGRF